jgi:hypothetical protein
MYLRDGRHAKATHGLRLLPCPVTQLLPDKVRDASCGLCFGSTGANQPLSIATHAPAWVSALAIPLVLLLISEINMHMQCLTYADHMIGSRRQRKSETPRVRTIVINGETYASDRTINPLKVAPPAMGTALVRVVRRRK